MPDTTKQVKKDFRELVLGLKRANPSWRAKEIADFLQQSENPPTIKRRSLLIKINKTIKRGTVEDRKRSGAKVRVLTPRFLKQVEKAVHLKKRASNRITAIKLKKKGVKCSRESVRRAVKKLKLKWFKKRKSQKLSEQNKLDRVKYAKILRKRFGVKKNTNNYKWNRVINTDFSGKFGLQPGKNPHNEGVYAYDRKELGSTGVSQQQKFEKGAMLWGGISSLGLIPPNAPINFTKWLQSKNAKYLTNELYADFIATKGAPEIRKVFDKTRMEPIFQDDQDTKQRTSLVLETVDGLFNQRIQPQDAAAKLADVWPIENVWGAIRTKLTGEEFTSQAAVITAVNKQWRTFTPEKCKIMMNKIPQRLKKVIDNKGEQVYEH